MLATPIKIWDIPGGIHPPEHKHESTQRGLEVAPIPARLVLPLQQHIARAPNLSWRWVIGCSKAS